MPMLMIPPYWQLYRKPADSPIFAASRNRDLARIQEWCNHWCMILNPKDRDGMPRARGIAAYVRNGHGAFRQPKFECGCCEMLVFRVCGAGHNF